MSRTWSRSCRRPSLRRIRRFRTARRARPRSACATSAHKRTLVLIDGKRMPYGSTTRLRGRPEPDPRRDGRAGRGPDRRRLGGVRLGRGRRRRQLHHEEGLRGRAARRPVRVLPAQERLRRAGRSQASRRDRRTRGNQPGAVRSCRTTTSPTARASRPASLVGATTEDGRGNITAFATVRDNEEVLQRDRDYSACSLNPTVDVYDGDRVRLVRCGGSSTSYPGRFPASLTTTDDVRLRYGRSDDREHVPGPFDSATGPVQLRADQLLPAARHALQPRRDGPLRARRVRGRLHAADVHRLRVDRADRARRRVSR